MIEKIAILISLESWFNNYLSRLTAGLHKYCPEVIIFHRHEDISKEFEIVFIISYFRIIEKNYLDMHQHNLVIHESDLPKGKGWSPMFWQILEGKNQIPIVLFEATPEIDSGEIFVKDTIELTGFELNYELREKQALKTIEICERYLKEYDDITENSQAQKGIATYYPKREPKDSELDIKKTIKENFNLLRIVNNEEYPAFFYIDGQKYFITISKVKESEKE